MPIQVPIQVPMVPMEVPAATSTSANLLPSSLAVAVSSEPQSHTQEGILAILTCWSSLIKYDYIHRYLVVGMEAAAGSSVQQVEQVD